MWGIAREALRRKFRALSAYIRRKDLECKIELLPQEPRWGKQ